MAQELPAEDFCHLAGTLVVELGEDGCRGALAREGEIDAVHQVHVDGNAVHDGIYPPRHAIIGWMLLPVKGQQEHQQDDGVGIKNRRRVEQQTCAEQFKAVAQGDAPCIERPVEGQKYNAAQRVGAIHHHQVP